MTDSRTAWLLCLLTVAGLLIGVTVLSAPSLPALFAAEVVKLGSAWAMWRIAPLARPAWLLQVAAALMALAGLIGLAAIYGESGQLGQAVTPLALVALFLTGLWGLQLARARELAYAAALAIAVSVSAVATWFIPPAGLLAALIGLAWWAVVARKLTGPAK